VLKDRKRPSERGVAGKRSVGGTGQPELSGETIQAGAEQANCQTEKCPLTVEHHWSSGMQFDMISGLGRSYLTKGATEGKWDTAQSAKTRN